MTDAFESERFLRLSLFSFTFLFLLVCVVAFFYEQLVITPFCSHSFLVQLEYLLYVYLFVYLGFIEMQDLLHGFTDPNVIDIKMGTRTFLESEVTNTTARADLYQKVNAHFAASTCVIRRGTSGFDKCSRLMAKHAQAIQSHPSREM